MQIRVLDERLAVARDNVRVQQDSLEIARVRFEAGGTSELDVQQATALLQGHRGDDPAARASRRRQAVDSLCVLLGVPPSELAQQLGGEPAHVPQAPCDDGRRHPGRPAAAAPDVRARRAGRAPRRARASASPTADCCPRFQLVGSVGLQRRRRPRNFFEGRSFAASTGPAFDWPILNYGRLINDVRLQDATFQELVVAYANTVLTAQQEVEDALVGYLRGSRAGRSSRPRASRRRRAPSTSRWSSTARAPPTSRRC